ncbi:MAG: GNAT family N-acetyltransferase [Pseudobutyrivibrio sp.]|nr:GNAT family N-acetyltransferase [Pseudobutyrivibrio sp.]
MLIRIIEKKDDAIIASIIRQCLIEYGGDHRPDTAWADPFLDRFSEVYIHDNNCYWVAENEDGQVIAGVGIGPLNGKEGICELQKMYCLPEYRGCGIAQKLLDTALDFAKQQYASCYLETMQNMDRAKSFYEKNGFAHTCETIGNTGHCGCDYHYILHFNHN